MNNDHMFPVDDKTIILLTAEEQVVPVLIEVIQRLHVRVYHARKIEDVVALAGEQLPDAIMIDGDKAGVDPSICHSAFKADSALSAVPVIILVNPESDRNPFRQAGFEAFLEKPLIRAEVISLLRQHVSLSERRNLRIPYYTPVTIHSNNEHYFGMSGDISLGGIFVASLDQLPHGRELKLTFSLVNKQPQMLEVLGRVAWINSKESSFSKSLPEGFGVQFVSVESEDLHAISEYIVNNRK